MKRPSGNGKVLLRQGNERRQGRKVLPKQVISMPRKEKPGKKKTKPTSPLRRRIRRKVRNYIGPKQSEEMGLKPVFKDGLVFHSQVRVGRKVPFKGGEPVAIGRGLETKGIKKKSTAIVATKIRTMEKGAHNNFETEGRAPKSKYTLIGGLFRRRKIDESPQIFALCRGDLARVGIRPLPKSLYRKLPEELRKVYDEVGPGLVGLQYLCKSKKPTYEEFMGVVWEFYKMWKKDPKKANRVYTRRFFRHFRPAETPIEDILGL